MKITNISKSVTYYVTTDDPEFPDYRVDETSINPDYNYRVDETGINLEVRMGESWETFHIEKGELLKMISDYLISNGC
jgi:hypothetical protein